jgi:hypothetical protein
VLSGVIETARYQQLFVRTMVGPIGALRNSTHTCEVWGRCPAPPAAAAPVGEVRSAAPRRAQMVRGTTVTDRRVHAVSRYAHSDRTDRHTTHDTTILVSRSSTTGARGGAGTPGARAGTLCGFGQRRALATSPLALRSKLKKTL